ncbi:MAG: molybdopterin-dependent oxidoreductase [Actinomycetota bacterium]|nr:molybdopterin-dependent oxidoreductase [Actinomycetota bacterium]
MTGEVARECVITSNDLSGLARRDIDAGLHCVTTWSHLGLRWSGVGFKDIYEQLIVPRAEPAARATRVVFKGADGYWASLALEDCLADDVLVADRLDGEPLTTNHGAPLRLVAPAHYGYKNVKHLRGFELRSSFRPGPGLLEHPRARVALEERGRRFPPRVLRILYRPFVAPVAWWHRRRA